MHEIRTTDMRDDFKPSRLTAWWVAAIMAGLLGWAMLESGMDLLTFADAAVAAAGEFPASKVSLRLARLIWWQDLANSAISLALVGAVLGLVFQRFTGPRNWRSSIKAGLLGLSIGVAAGLSGASAFASREVGDQDLTFASVIQALAWGCLGLGAGLAASRGGFRVPKAGLMGGAAWGLAYPIAASLVTPWHHVEQLIPGSAPHRAAWVVVGCVVVGFSLHRAGASLTSAAPASRLTSHSQFLTYGGRSCAEKKDLR